MEISKIKSYVGFAKKSGNLVIGLDNLLKSFKVKLVIISDELSGSSLNKLDNFVKNKGIDKLVLSSKLLGEIIGSEMIKVFAITDKGLADAIKMNFTNIS